MYAFLHYSLNTYTDQEWGFGNEDPVLFNPSQLDVKQWVTTCKNAGMRGIILTAKHHCGFCLWPSQYTDFSVKSSPWRDGKGDVVRELSDECRRQGLKFGVYLSPWDRHHPQYGQHEYITYFRNQLEELLTQYGNIFEVWFDGANGGDGWYGGANEKRKIDRMTYYQWSDTYRLIRQWQPEVCIWADVGTRADLRWVGTEAGYVGTTNWSLLNEGKAPKEALHYGEIDADAWVPGEVDTSIRPGWFYHEREDSLVKTADQLMDIYLKSVGRNATLLLNFPIMPNGRIHPTDSLHGAQFYERIRATFGNDLARNAKISVKRSIPSDTLHAAEMLLAFQQPTTFNCVQLQEDIALGQRVKRFALDAWVDGAWKPLDDMLAERPADDTTHVDALTTIGYKRIVCFPEVSASKLRIRILEAKAQPVIKQVGVYYDSLLK